ncbi:MAG: hypothetical protein ACRDHW_15465, partial [Ktedonobacteraceae bacterium]
TQLTLDGTPGKTVLVAWEYREASWMAPFIRGCNAYTGLLLQDVLNFDPYHETWEKRLAKYFLFWLRTNAKNGRKPKITIRDLFTELNLTGDIKHPQDIRDHFERAMNILAQKQERTGKKEMVSTPHLHWRYANEDLNLPARKWYESWLVQEIIVENPPYLSDLYKDIQIEVQTQQEAQAQLNIVAQQRIQQKSATTKTGRRGRPPGSKNKK